MRQESFVVSVGASAGGIEALKLFFSKISKNPGVPFIVVQHLARHNNSELAHLLSKHTALKVTKVTGQEKVKPNHIYVIKENCNMIIKSGNLYVRERPLAEATNTTIDFFFKSLAEDAREKAICILLGVTGTDGVEGSKAVKARGGTVMVQEASEVNLNAIQKIEQPDYIGSIPELAQRVMEIISPHPVKLS